VLQDRSVPQIEQTLAEVGVVVRLAVHRTDVSAPVACFEKPLLSGVIKEADGDSGRQQAYRLHLYVPYG